MKLLKAFGSFFIGVFTYIILVIDRQLTVLFVGMDQPGVRSLTNPHNMNNRAKSKYYVKVAKRILIASTIYGAYYTYNLIF